MHKLEEKISYEFKDKDLFLKSITHKSWANEIGQDDGNNEKLEFLGDAVLELALSDLLYKTFPENKEGDLSKKRASLVNENALSLMAQTLEIGNFIRLGKGEVQSNGGQKPRLLASCYEALIGAIYLDSSFDTVKEIIHREFYHSILKLNGESFDSDYKTRLQEKLQDEHKETPLYEVINEKGPAHDKTFEVQITFKGKKMSTGEGKSKKVAEQSAAKSALEKIEQGEL